jgi:alkylation response protein AidB-like acyl-CoA dehydrogenase
MIRKFGKENIYPQMMEWDEAQIFPVEVFKKLGDLGLMGVLVRRVWWVWIIIHRIRYSYY